jgi:predicted helicase
MSAAAASPLWAHQREAADAAVKILAESERTTLVAACGSGKTRTGGEIAARIALGSGRLLVLAPSLDLLAQILHEYRTTFGDGWVGRAIAVCSDNAIHHSEVDMYAEGAAVTTDPARLAALLAAPGRATVACTYHSLGVLREAHARHGLAPWGLAIMDEAHRTTGRVDKPWTAIHDDAAIPCVRRLYLTATPRIMADPDSGQAAVSMDDEAIFGPVAHTLTFAEAIERGLLADYRVIVPVITDAEVSRLFTAALDAPHLTAGGFAVSPQMLATQVALLRAAAQHDARRVITYHRRVTSADAFAVTLYAAAGLLEPQQRPDRLTALSVSGRARRGRRRPILARLASDQPGTVVVSNARVLGEGVNIPTVDGVGFIDPLGSSEFVIQAVGRALRTGGLAGKIAKVFVPVHIGPEENMHADLDDTPWRALWATIRALRAHDERLAAGLDLKRRISGKSTAREDFEMPDWMSLTGAPVPAGFASAVKVRMLEATTSSWQASYGRALAYHAEHGHLAPTRTEDRELNTWVDLQRQRRRRRLLSGERAALLDALGIAWDPLDESWQRALADARAYHRAHGHLSPAADAMWAGEPPRRIGKWVTKQRARHRAGELPLDRVAALEELGIVWEPEEPSWARLLEAAREYREQHGHLRVPKTQTWGVARR